MKKLLCLLGGHKEESSFAVDRDNDTLIFQTVCTVCGKSLEYAFIELGWVKGALMEEHDAESCYSICLN